MQSKEETRNETVRKRNCGSKQAEHDEALSVVWNESIKAGRQITEEYREGREKVMEYKDFVEQENEILLNNYYFKQLNSLKNM